MFLLKFYVICPITKKNNYIVSATKTRLFHRHFVPLGPVRQN